VRKRERELLFFKGMTGALAPFSYLAVNKVLRDGPVAGLRSGEGTTFVGSTVNLEKTFLSP
jgi:hypothetical protein